MMAVCLTSLVIMVLLVAGNTEASGLWGWDGGDHGFGAYHGFGHYGYGPEHHYPALHHGWNHWGWGWH